MTRPYNFSAGPAVLPEAVLQRAREEMLDWQGSGMSVMEMSHRGKEFMSIAALAEADLRNLLSIPDVVSAGWCQHAVRDGALEFTAQQKNR